ncbi:hypothetical protein ACOME3_008224 [Neoechinorhynchus agilis]
MAVDLTVSQYSRGLGCQIMNCCKIVIIVLLIGLAVSMRYPWGESIDEEMKSYLAEKEGFEITDDERRSMLENIKKLEKDLNGTGAENNVSRGEQDGRRINRFNSLAQIMKRNDSIKEKHDDKENRIVRKSAKHAVVDENRVGKNATISTRKRNQVEFIKFKISNTHPCDVLDKPIIYNGSGKVTDKEVQLKQ